MTGIKDLDLQLLEVLGGRKPRARSRCFKGREGCSVVDRPLAGHQMMGLQYGKVMYNTSAKYQLCHLAILLAADMCIGTEQHNVIYSKEEL